MVNLFFLRRKYYSKYKAITGLQYGGSRRPEQEESGSIREVSSEQNQGEGRKEGRKKQSLKTDRERRPAAFLQGVFFFGKVYTPLI